ncbi:hypothetical protein IH824_19275 [candidate division KSB1 bacterium]|nr:hypothetical protein [candidate division KSB1 bacterium]
MFTASLHFHSYDKSRGAPIDWNIISKIKAEGFNNSQVMETMFYLTDVHGRACPSRRINYIVQKAGELAEITVYEQKLVA